MVDVSLGFSSFMGLVIFIWAIFAGFVGLIKLRHSLGSKKDAQTSYIPKFAIVIQSYGRMIGLPIVAYLGFFQSWRMEDVLQNTVSLLMIGLLVESVPGVFGDFYRWQVRKGRKVPFAEIMREDEPSRVTQSKSNFTE